MQTMMMAAWRALVGVGLMITLAGTPARAAETIEAETIKIGVSISTTGQGAALGIPEKNTLDLVPREIGGAKVEIIQLDDAGDATNATTNARRLATEDKVDILIGSSVTPASLAMANVAYENAVPHFALSPVALAAERASWTFIMPQPVPLMAKGLIDDMVARKIKRIGVIGFSDSWGDIWVKAFKADGVARGIALIADERYARADTSLAGQVLKLVAARPDAILVAASGTAAALPVIALRQRGYAGPIYETHGAVTRDFIRIAGKSAEGVILTSGPVVVAAKEDDSAPTKAPGVDYTRAYEAKFGAGSVNMFGAHMYDTFEVLKRVLPVALKTAKPGTRAFRDAVRAALESEKDVAATQAVYNYTPTNHNGVDDRCHVLLIVKNGDWTLVK